MTAPEPACLHRVFERRAAHAGSRRALTDGSRTYTYEELNAAANRLAHRLIGRGAGPGTFVGVCGDRSADLVVSILAVLKSGAAYVPLDPAYPAGRTEFILADTACRIVVGQDRHRTAFASVDYVPVEAPAGPGGSDLNPETGVTAGHPAYVIHTSGSTGTPKGVIVTHANADRLFHVCRDELGIAPVDSDDVWTFFHSCAFDFSVWELWGALLHGGRLVIVPYTTSRSPDSFLRLLGEEGVTVLSQTPTAFRQLVRTAEAEGFPETGLRLIVFGGEALEPSSLRRWIERYGSGRPRLVNMYGITETTVHVTLRDITAADCAVSRSPLGHPLRDLRVHVLGPGLRPVAPGEQGEMYVGGAGVTLGYLNRPGLTAQRFVPDPFGGLGQRLYRSGDLAVVTAGGELEFRGRADDQVQLRGFRVELGEIEAALSSFDEVREAAVTLRADALGEAMLVGYAVLSAGSTATADDLIRRLADRLPGHMVPPVLVLLGSFPLTPNGKLDRTALPEPRARTAASAPATDAAPVDGRGSEPAEQVLVRVWAKALGRTEVDPGLNFFALGGDSITAIRVVGMAREAGVAFKSEDLFRYPTIAELARHCALAPDDGAPAEPAPAAEPMSDAFALLCADDVGSLPPEVCAAYPLTPLQLGMVFESELSGDPTLYHDLVSVRVDGTLDVDALRRTLELLASRHDILRTSFDLGGYSEPLQLVHDRIAVPLHHGAKLPAAGTALDAVKSWWRQEWLRPFKTGAPLWRCYTHDHKDGTFQLSVSAHHSILDGWSFALLVTELVATYEHEAGGLAAPAGPPTHPFRAYVGLERAESGSEAAREYWERVVRGALPTPLPAPDGGGVPAVEPDVRLPLPADLVAAARDLADRLGVPARSVFLAVHLWALRAATGTHDLTTGVVANGRPEYAESEDSLGLFLNSVPLRSDVSGGSWAELIRSVFAEERALLPFRRFPLADIQAMAGVAPFSVLFNYTDFRPFDALEGLRELRVVDWWFCDRTSFPLVLEVGRQAMGTEWELTVKAHPGKVAAAFCAPLAEHFLDGLRRVSEGPFDVY
ncbi:amino acid adenylation domain-containing protein (plasmid) [Streptomyces decoyicus]|uniref:non-ribosomal peptide synthetase n=1 Tax=Streptomyces decoyicus TaxID=249567 RepID=UPI002E30C778|nr:amino acid adenylation domain-containing protein [Streptomyces decoyicus]